VTSVSCLLSSQRQYKKCVHLWNNFPCISTLQWMPLWIRNCHLLRGLLKIHLQLFNLGLITTISLFSRGLQFKPDQIQREVAIYTVRIPTEGYHLCWLMAAVDWIECRKMQILLDCLTKGSNFLFKNRCKWHELHKIPSWTMAFIIDHLWTLHLNKNIFDSKP